jgi:broad specificity phosphatase PhoE
MGSTRLAAVKGAFEAFRSLHDACQRGAGDAPRAAQALYEGVREVARVGCEIEGAFVRALLDQVAALAPFNGREGLWAHLDYSGAQLRGVPWWRRDREESAEPPAEIVFVRHSESTGNIEQRLQGARIGGALTPRGHAQSRLTASHLFDAFEHLRGGKALLASSPSDRAMQTANEIAGRLESAVHIEQGLGEIDFGDWTGRCFADLQRDDDYVAWMKDRWFRAPPGGESMFEVRTRMFEALASLLCSARAESRPLIVVTHFFPLVACFGALAPQAPIHPDNSSITRFSHAPDGWQCRLANFVGHLGAEAAVPVAYV